MRFGRGLQAEFQDVGVLFKNPRNGNVEIVAIDVRMAILPIPSSSNDIGQDLQQPYRQRYGGVLETPRTDFRERNNIIQPTTKLLSDQALGAAFNIAIPDGTAGQLRITVSAVVDGSSLAIVGTNVRGNAQTETVGYQTGDPVSKASDRTWQTITSVTPSGFGSETADIVLWKDGDDLVVRRPLGVKGYQELELESVGSI